MAKILVFNNHRGSRYFATNSVRSTPRPPDMARHLLLLLVVALTGVTADAQPYPSRPVKVLLGFTAGGPPDVVARRIAAKLESRLGTAVIIENRPGASGTIAATSVARAQPDGYTLLFGVAANLAVAPASMREPPYDPRAAFTPIVEVARGPYVWLVRADAPATTMHEFVAWARAQPGKLNYASPGPGSVHHLATELLKRETAMELVHVPYKGGLYTALLAGEVQAMFESMPGPIPHLAAGKLRALAVTGAKRLPALREVPTLRELGFREPDVQSWWGFVAPANLPASIVDRLNREIREVLADPEVAAILTEWNITPSAGSPDAFGRLIAQEWVRWSETV